jgi:hypothetical protein
MRNLLVAHSANTIINKLLDIPPPKPTSSINQSSNQSIRINVISVSNKFRGPKAHAESVAYKSGFYNFNGPHKKKDSLQKPNPPSSSCLEKAGN